MPIKAWFKRKNSAFKVCKPKFQILILHVRKPKLRGEGIYLMLHSKTVTEQGEPHLSILRLGVSTSSGWAKIKFAQRHTFSRPGQWGSDNRRNKPQPLRSRNLNPLCTVQEGPLPDQKLIYSRTSTTTTEDECMEYTEITLAILLWTRRGKWVKQMG